MLGKRKERLIRDIVADVIAAIERIVINRLAAQIERPCRGAQELEALIERATEAVDDLIEWKQVTTSLGSDPDTIKKGVKPDSAVWTRHVLKKGELMKAYGHLERSVVKASQTYRNPGSPETGVLILERVGLEVLDYRLVAYLSGETPHVFCEGTEEACESVWPDAVKWMKNRFPEPEPDESAEPILSEVKDTPWVKDYGDPETGLARLIISRTGPTSHDFALVAYLSDAVPYPFERGTVDACIAVWPAAVEWMEDRFSENKA